MQDSRPLSAAARRPAPSHGLSPESNLPAGGRLPRGLDGQDPAGAPTAPGEMGVLCALGRAIPLVVAGVGGGSLEGLATTVVSRHDSVVSAFDEAAVTTALGPAGW